MFTLIFDGVRVAPFLSFLFCAVMCVCYFFYIVMPVFVPMCYVPNVGSVSGLSVLNFPFGFLLRFYLVGIG